MQKTSLILVGGGGHCKSCIDIIEATDKYFISGILDDKKKLGHQISGYKISGTDDDIPMLAKEDVRFIVTVGQIKDSTLRIKLFNSIKNFGGKLATVISPYAIVNKSFLLLPSKRITSDFSGLIRLRSFSITASGLMR